MRVVYVIDEFPPITQTFVHREIDALTEQGVDVLIYPLQVTQEAIGSDKRLLRTSRSRFLTCLRALPSLLRRPLAIAKLVRSFVFGRSPGIASRNLYAIIRAVDLDDQLARHAGDWPLLHAHFAARCVDVAQFNCILSGGARTYTVTVHAADIYAPDSGVELMRRLGSARTVVAISKHARAHLRAIGYEGHCELVRCGVDVAALRKLVAFEPGRQLEKPLDSTACKARLVTIGRFVEKKGWSNVLAAAKHLKSAGIEFEWVCIGDGPLRANMEALAAASGVADDLRFTGTLPNAAALQYVNGAAAFVLPCQRAATGDMDGIPVSLMESMALRVPVITTNIGAIGELVKDGVNGIICEADAEKIADAIVQLLRTPALAKKLVSGGEHTVETEFAILHQTRRLIQVIATDASPDNVLPTESPRVLIAQGEDGCS